MIKINFFVGESGCGKTHLQELLMKRYPNTYTRIMSTTTRKPREGEVHWESYHFMQEDEFKYRLDNCDFLQHVLYGTTYYGTQIKEYKQEQDNGIFVCTPEGIMDTVLALKATGMCFDFQIVYFMANIPLLKRHGIDQKRIDRGSISEKWTELYYNGLFEGIPLEVVTADQVNNSLCEKIHRVIG